MDATHTLMRIRAEYGCMTRQVQLSDRAYRLLSTHKRPGESFSDAIERLARQDKRPHALVGAGLSSLDVEARLRVAGALKGPSL